jgi:inhibitor of cysteine peptidase
MKRLFRDLQIIAAAGLVACVVVLEVSRAENKCECMQITINQADLKENPTTITKTVAKGDKLEVRLEQKATGYIWKLVKHDPERLKRIGDVTTETPDNSKPGESEYKVFRFEVLGDGDLEFQLLRPFGKPQPKGLTLSIKLKP